MRFAQDKDHQFLNLSVDIVNVKRNGLNLFDFGSLPKYDRE